MDWSEIVIILIVIFMSVYSYTTWNYWYWAKQGIPCVPDAIPGFGHAFSLVIVRENLALLSERLHKKMGSKSMLGFYYLRTPALMIRDPEMIKSVLVTNFSNFADNLNRLSPHLDPLLANTPFFSSGEIWKNSRVGMVHALAGKKLKHIFSIVNRVCIKCKYYLAWKINDADGVCELELRDFFFKFTGEVAANAGLGIEGHSFEHYRGPQSFASLAKDMFQPTTLGGIQGALRTLVPSIADFFRIRVMPLKVDKFFRNTVNMMAESRRQHYTATNDFLDFTAEEMRKRDVNSICAQVSGFFFDVYDTSSAVLHFVAYRLQTNPDVQERARSEVNDVFEKYNDQLTYESLKELTYLEQVILESIRMNPPLGTLVKICTKETYLKSSDGQNCRLVPGTMVFISIDALHRDEEFWYLPKLFDPERFSAENKERITKFSFLPFGEGPRICVGMRMGMMQVKAALATILRNYELLPSDKTKPPLKMDPNTNTVVVKGGLWGKFAYINGVHP